MADNVTYDVDDDSVEITGKHPENPNEKPVTVPVDGDDGMPVIQEAEHEPIVIVSETEAKAKAEPEIEKKDDNEDEVENDDDDDVTRELKRQRNRARRQANRDRQRRAADFKNSEIRRLSREVADLKARQENSSVVSKLDEDRNAIQRLKDESATRLMLAEKKMQEAFKGGDEVAHTTALKEMYSAQTTIERADTALQNIDARKKNPPAAQEAPVDNFVAEMVQDFRKKNSWFDPNLMDRDSKRAKRISEDLLREGYDAGDEDYWEELQDRIGDELPHRAAKTEEAPVKQQPAPVKKLPISSGGGREVRGFTADGKVSTSDITPMQRSILKQMGYAEGSKEWLEHALDMKKRNQTSKQN